MLGTQSSDDAPRPIDWRANLAVLWVGQFITQSAYFFCAPFFPMFLREYQIVPADDVQFWTGIYFSGSHIGLMIMSPIWGMIGDRFGRKMMLVRATLAGAIVLYCMGSARSIAILITLRLLQGAFTGTIPIAQTMVTNATPPERQGFAIGLLMAGIPAGNAAGVFLGGMFARYYGAANTFKMAGFVLFLTTFMVVFLVRDNFVKPVKVIENLTDSARLARREERLDYVKTLLPMLLCLTFVALFQNYDLPLFSLYVDEIFRAGDPVARGLTETDIQGQVYQMIGLLSALATIVAVIGSTVIGWVLDKKAPPWVWTAFSLAGALGILWISLDPSFLGLAFGRCIYLFVINGVASILVVVLARMALPHRKSAVMGWAFTARSLGWAISSLLGSFAALKWGYGGAYLLMAILCLGLVPMFRMIERYYAFAFRPTNPEPSAPAIMAETAGEAGMEEDN